MTTSIRLRLNGKPTTRKTDGDRSLLTVLRTDLRLTGTKYGCGEPAIVPMGAVVANAVFDATGVRFYRLPLTPGRVRAALEKRRHAG